jgi:hypothetical protein
MKLGAANITRAAVYSACVVVVSTFHGTANRLGEYMGPTPMHAMFMGFT